MNHEHLLPSLLIERVIQTEDLALLVFTHTSVASILPLLSGSSVPSGITAQAACFLCVLDGAKEASMSVQSCVEQVGKGGGDRGGPITKHQGGDYAFVLE